MSRWAEFIPYTWSKVNDRVGGPGARQAWNRALPLMDSLTRVTGIRRLDKRDCMTRLEPKTTTCTSKRNGITQAQPAGKKNKQNKQPETKP